MKSAVLDPMFLLLSMKTSVVVEVSDGREEVRFTEPEYDKTR
jgi:hypothetical protein